NAHRIVVQHHRNPLARLYGKRAQMRGDGTRRLPDLAEAVVAPLVAQIDRMRLLPIARLEPVHQRAVQGYDISIQFIDIQFNIVHSATAMKTASSADSRIAKEMN